MSSLHFHNGLNHFGALRDNQEKRNHRAIRQLFLNIPQALKRIVNKSCFLIMVQLGPRYEGQLNPMAEHIPHEVRPLVRTHVYHPYQARTDRQRPIVEFNRRGRVFAPFYGCSLKSRECYNRGPRMASP